MAKILESVKIGRAAGGLLPPDPPPRVQLCMYIRSFYVFWVQNLPVGRMRSVGDRKCSGSQNQQDDNYILKNISLENCQILSKSSLFVEFLSYQLARVLLCILGTKFTHVPKTVCWGSPNVRGPKTGQKTMLFSKILVWENCQVSSKSSRLTFYPISLCGLY